MAYFPDGAAPPTPTPIGSVTGASLSQAAIRGDGGGPAPRAVYTEHLAVPYVAPAVTQNMPRASPRAPGRCGLGVARQARPCRWRRGRLGPSRRPRRRTSRPASRDPPLPFPSTPLRQGAATG